MSWTTVLRVHVVLLCVHPYGGAPTRDAVIGPGVEVPEHLEKELEVSRPSGEVQTLSGVLPDGPWRSLEMVNPRFLRVFQSQGVSKVTPPKLLL